MCDRLSASTEGEAVFEKCSELCCDYEKADTRLLLHARHASTAHDRVIIRSPDADVFIFLLVHINQQYLLLCTSTQGLVTIEVKFTNLFFNH